MKKSELYPKFSTAPMLDWTDRHCRYFYRLMSDKALLYSEMVTTGAILHGDQDRHLGFKENGPVALQLGGSSPMELVACAKIGEQYGYDEINLNCGCPSDRVQKGAFGACLMKMPELVAECYQKMNDAVSIPVTIKMRIGVDQEESFEFLEKFIVTLASAGCKIFILHARKAWLSGLSPKENREIPPLNYERVYEIKKRYPQLTIAINGGIQTVDETLLHLQFVDSVMVGRSIFHHPYQLVEVDSRIFGQAKNKLTRCEIIERMEPYIVEHLANGGRLSHVVKPMLGLFHNQPGSRLWRRYLSENMHQFGANYLVLQTAYQQMRDYR